MGLIYLINEIDTDNYKIGYTNAKTTNSRKITLQTGNSKELIVIKTFSTQNPSKLEKMLHRHFSQAHINGEWYQLSYEDVNLFISICQKLDDTILFLLKNNSFYN